MNNPDVLEDIATFVDEMARPTDSLDLTPPGPRL